MKIESILKRPNGTTIELDGVNYHFKPESGVVAAPHICEVEEPGHLAILLAIPEGYRIYIPPATAETASEPAPAARTVVAPESSATTMPVAGVVTTDAKPPAHPAPAAAGAKPLTAAQKKKAKAAEAKAAETMESPVDDDDADAELAAQVREELGELDDGELEDEYARVKGKSPGAEMTRAELIEAIATHAPAEG